MEYYDIYPEELRERKPYTLNEKPTLHQGVRLHACHIGAWTEIGPHTSMAETVFGDYSYIAGDGQIIYAEVGKFCSLASHVRINPGNHPVQRVTQHHMTYRRRMYGMGDHDDQEFFNWRRAARCVIGHDVWMGHGAIIMPGVNIGIGAVVGAGAVVTRNVEPYMVVAGVPAQPIRKRFADSTITALLRIAWWHWDRATLEERFDDLMDIEQFVAKYGK